MSIRASPVGYVAVFDGELLEVLRLDVAVVLWEPAICTVRRTTAPHGLPLQNPVKTNCKSMAENLSAFSIVKVSAAGNS